MDWKPSVCWQLPIRVEWEERDERTEVATVRRWSRADWGEEGETMAWCCTEGKLAYVGDERVIDSLRPRDRGDRRPARLRHPAGAAERVGRAGA